MARYKIILTIGTPAHLSDFSIVNSAGEYPFRFYDQTPPVHYRYDVRIEMGASGTAANFYSIVNAEYNIGGIWLTQLFDTVVVIYMDSDTIPTEGDSNGGVTFDVTEVAPSLSILSYTPSTNTNNPCDLVDVTVVGSKEFNEIISPIQDTFPNTTSYKVTGLLRASLAQFEIKDDLSQVATGAVVLPSRLDVSLIQVEVVGASIVVNSAFSDLVLEYSLDNLTWQASNTFNGLTAGDYTIYVRDQFECTVSIPVTIEEGTDGVITIPDPYFFYSDANPLRMAKREEWDDCSIFKNDHNTLSCESTDRVVHTEKQRFRSCDVINLQFKNNYNDLVVETSDNPGSPLLLTQKSKNLDNKQALDCNIIKLTDTTNGIYFLTGETYDYDTLTPLNEPYSLQGELPGWAAIDQVVTINNFNYTIVDIVFNETLQVNQIVINAVLNEGPNIIKAIYNLFDYELYEVAIPLSGHTAPFNVQVKYDGDVLRYASEQVYPDDYTDNLLPIRYYMSYNTDMFFATGIQPMFRLQKDRDNATLDRANEGFETDDTALQIDVNNYRVNTFKFLPVTKGMARTIAVAFACDNVNINGVDYKTENLEFESLEDSNLYVITATMKEKGSGLSREYGGSYTISLPALIDYGQGYIKI